MDRRTFVEQAPLYYALAIVTFLQQNSNQTDFTAITKIYSEFVPEENETWYFYDREYLFEKAIKWLEEENVVIAILDYFGPGIVQATLDFDEETKRLFSSGPKAFQNYAMLSYPEAWLKSALKNVYREALVLKITEDDFKSSENDEWEPIPLEQSQEVAAVAERVQDLLEAVRGDNGYAAGFPEEKNRVQDALTVFENGIKNKTSTSIGYIRSFAIEPIDLLIKRFGKAAIGVGAQALKAAIFEWLKQAGVEAIKVFFK